MKIAVVDPLGGHGGFHYYIDGLARGLKVAGVDVSVFVSAHTAITGEEPYRITQTFGVIFSDEPKWRRGLRFVTGMTRSLIKARVADNRVINFHIFHYEWMEVLATSLARLLGFKIILTLHDVLSFGGRSSERSRTRILENADAIIVHNAFSLEALQQSADVSAKSVAVIPHGHYGMVYPEPPAREAARSRIGLDENTFTFLFFGNSRPEKGLDLLIEAASGLSPMSDWLLLIAGKMKKEQLDYYRKLAERGKLGPRVRMDIGLISEKDAADYFAAVDLVVVPYRQIYESGVTIMAQTLAAPVLVSDLAPLLDSVDNGKCGRIFDAGDSGALRKALEAAMSERDMLAELGRQGRRRALATRDWIRIGEMTRDFLVRLDQ